MKKLIGLILIFVSLFCAIACDSNPETSSSEPPKDDMLWQNDLSGYDAYSQETRIEYGFAWKPKQKDGYVGDIMPYYENGVYSLFYLKDEGGSLRHSVYRVDTKDFIEYEDKGLVLESRSIAFQDYWIGTGSVVKAENDYYFFYTGHNPNKEVWENVLVAKSEGNMDHFVRVNDFAIAPPPQYNQRDFRDPQVFYNSETKKFDMTVETNSGGRARIVRFSVSLDLKQVALEGEVYVDEKYGFWNLECADIFEKNGKYYLTYNAQGNPMDTVWIAESDKMFSGYVNHRRLEGLNFYAAKTVVGDDGIYLIGWLYRRRDNNLIYNDRAGLYWGGHVVVHKIEFDKNGDPYLAPLDGYDEYYGSRGNLYSSEKLVFSSNASSKTKLADGTESFMIKGDFSYNGNDKFGLVLGYNDSYQRYVCYDPNTKKLKFIIDDDRVSAAEVDLTLEENKQYSFVFVQEGSVGLFYVLGEGGLSFRVHGVNNKIVGIYSDGSAVTFDKLEYYRRVRRDK